MEWLLRKLNLLSAPSSQVSGASTIQLVLISLRDVPDRDFEDAAGVPAADAAADAAQAAGLLAQLWASGTAAKAQRGPGGGGSAGSASSPPSGTGAPGSVSAMSPSALWLFLRHLEAEAAELGGGGTEGHRSASGESIGTRTIGRRRPRSEQAGYSKSRSSSRRRKRSGTGGGSGAANDDEGKEEEGEDNDEDNDEHGSSRGNARRGLAPLACPPLPNRVILELVRVLQVKVGLRPPAAGDEEPGGSAAGAGGRGAAGAAGSGASVGAGPPGSPGGASGSSSSPGGSMGEGTAMSRMRTSLKAAIAGQVILEQQQQRDDKQQDTEQKKRGSGSSVSSVGSISSISSFSDMAGGQARSLAGTSGAYAELLLVVRALAVVARSRPHRLVLHASGAFGVLVWMVQVLWVMFQTYQQHHLRVQSGQLLNAEEQSGEGGGGGGGGTAAG
eukprot:g3507.t1